MTQHKLHLLMCRASEYGLNYEINPWMNATRKPDRAQALEQQQEIINTLQQLGHQIDFVDPGADMPDMCFAANAAVVRDGKVFLSNLPAERQPESPLYEAWFKSHGYQVQKTNHRFGGGGDALWCGDQLIAGSGDKSRRATDIEVHAELADYFGVNVASVAATDERFYDLDMAIGILSPELIAYCGAVLDEDSVAKLKSLEGIDAIEVGLDDALGFGCNLISDGHNVIISLGAPGLIKQLQDRGFNVLPHNIDQFMLTGGGVRCLALNLS
jgi:N-dimethylarginine dimethylaminohydrolase